MLQNTGFEKKLGAGPKARVCFICGRQYMLHSFDIHVEQCRELFEKRESLKPVKERKKCPVDPMLSYQAENAIGSSGKVLSRAEVDTINSLSQTTWQTNTLAVCAYCNRSFLPEKLAIHNRACTADHPARRVDESVNRRNITTNAPAESNSGGGMNGSNNTMNSNPTVSMKMNRNVVSSGGAAGMMDGKINTREMQSNSRSIPTTPRLNATDSGVLISNSRRGSGEVNSNHAANIVGSRTSGRAIAMPVEAELPIRRPANNTGSSSTGTARGSEGKKSMVPATMIAGGYSCPHCCRSFNEKAYNIHVKLCLKIFQSKRKPFDARKQRIKGIMELNEVSLNQLKSIKASNNSTGTGNSMGKSGQMNSTAMGGVGGMKSKGLAQEMGLNKTAGMGNTGSRGGNMVGSTVGTTPPIGIGMPGTSSSSSAPANRAAVMPKWKLQSLQFRQAMKQARMYAAETATSGMNPSSTGVSGGNRGGNNRSTGNSSSSTSSGAVGRNGTSTSIKSRAGNTNTGAGNSNSRPNSQARQSMQIEEAMMPTYDPSYIQCPHCLRRYNEKAAERHIPKCANIIAKPKVLLQGSGHSPVKYHM